MKIASRRTAAAAFCSFENGSTGLASSTTGINRSFLSLWRILVWLCIFYLITLRLLFCVLCVKSEVQYGRTGGRIGGEEQVSDTKPAERARRRFFGL